jgi:excinuclease ABC subunit C
MTFCRHYVYFIAPFHTPRETRAFLRPHLVKKASQQLCPQQQQPQSTYKSRAFQASGTTPGPQVPSLPEKGETGASSDRWQRLRPQILALPRSCGVYFFRDRKGRLLYVGKSLCIQERVASYFRTSSVEQRGRQVIAALDSVDRVEYFVTGNEVEALAVESNFIREHQPPYNTLRKDDKRFPFVRVTWSEMYPRLVVTRQRPRVNQNTRGRDRVYGPFVDSKLLNHVLRFIQRTFPMRQRAQPLFRDRPCLNYDIGVCPGVCQKQVDTTTYREAVRRAELCLQGRVTQVLSELQADMQHAVKKEDYERAASLRDAMRALQRIAVESTVGVVSNLTQRVLLMNADFSADVAAAAITQDGKIVSIELIQMRDGMVMNRLHFSLRVSPLVRDTEMTHTQGSREQLDHIAAAVLQQTLIEHYANLTDANENPDGILVYPALQDHSILEKLFQERWRSRRVRVETPRTGLRAELVQLAKENAEAHLKDAYNQITNAVGPLEDLAMRLGLAQRPFRIECFDISHLSGTCVVASQSVFLDGVPAPHAYRRYRLNQNDSDPAKGANDLLNMQQVLRRRFRRAAESAPVDLPDLVLIDGGIEQLKAACSALEACGLSPRTGAPNLIALAKRDEEVYTLHSTSPLQHFRDGSVDSMALRLLRHIRDEAHNFALQYHRQLRNRGTMASVLERIPGLGPVRIQILLNHFGSFEGIFGAGYQQLAAIPRIGEKLAQRIHEYLHETTGN